MSKTGQTKQPPGTIWRVSDELWAFVQPVLNELDPPKPTRRKWIDRRAALDVIIFRLRSGCQWNQFPSFKR